MSSSITRTPFSRVFIIEDRAGPANTPEYLGLARAMAFSWPQGDVTPVRIPDENQYGQFKVIDEIRGAEGLPALPLQVRYAEDLSRLLKLVRKGCRLDIQVHMGRCKDPRDANKGWHKILVLEAARPTDFTTSELGALDSGEDAVVNEDVPMTGLDAYEIVQLLLAELGATEVQQAVVDVALCDSVSCGECGTPSDGCQKLFAITVSQGASPGLPAELIYSDDQGATLGETNVTTLGAAEDPSAMACVGTYLVVVSNDSDSLHYASIADILNGVEAWTEMGTGFVGAGSPNDIFSLGSRYTWIVGDGGYVYFTDDVTASVSVQDAGVAASGNDLYCIHGYDELNLIAGGELNTLIHTINGGSTWTAITMPVARAADGILAVWMHSEKEWIVGYDTGYLYYTRDGGDNWTQKAFPGHEDGSITDISFATPTVGYMSHNPTTGSGRILRTIDGGFSWYVLPEDAGTIPANGGIAALVACGEDVNFVFGGGDATGVAPADGFLVKGKGS